MPGNTINTNLLSLGAQRNLGATQSSLETAITRLSSAKRINGAKDDAAGLCIGERMQAQVKGMNVAIRNANDAISLTQTGEGALIGVGENLQRMRELAVQSNNATNNPSDKDSLDKEFGELAKENQRVLGGTTFNKIAILGADAGDLVFQIGPNTTDNDQITIATIDMTSDSTMMTVNGTDNLASGRAVIDSTNTNIADVIDAIDAAIDLVNGERAMYGAIQNRFDAVIRNLNVSVENQSAARSRIMDADFAVETSNLSRAQILQQSGMKMVAQANQLPQNVLSLLG